MKVPLRTGTNNVGNEDFLGEYNACLGKRDSVLAQGVGQEGEASPDQLLLLPHPLKGHLDNPMDPGDA